MNWEHSHVVSDEIGIKSFCVYEAPNEERLREHGDMVRNHTIVRICEIAGDVTPADFTTSSKRPPGVIDVGERRVVDGPLQLDLPPPALVILGSSSSTWL